MKILVIVMFRKIFGYDGNCIKETNDDDEETVIIAGVIMHGDNLKFRKGNC